MTESKLYLTEVKPVFKNLGAFVCRIEHKRVPDVYIAKNNKSLWIELKCVHSKSNVIDPGWRPGQLSWIKEHQRLGGNIICLVLWRCEEVYFLKPKENYKEGELICQKQHYLKKLLSH